jgi:hypothetical protein
VLNLIRLHQPHLRQICPDRQRRRAHKWLRHPRLPSRPMGKATFEHRRRLRQAVFRSLIFDVSIKEALTWGRELPAKVRVREYPSPADQSPSFPASRRR